MSAPEHQTFHLPRRGYLIAQALLYMIFTSSCVVQAVYRFDLEETSFLTSWWFYALLSAAFAYLTVEASYKLFFTRLVFTREGFVLVDFLKVTRLNWDLVKMVGEIDLKDRKRVAFGLILKEAATKKPNRLSMPFVSLAPFITSWNASPLKAWLMHYKPGLVKK
jgi:hypothetical protein